MRVASAFRSLRMETVIVIVDSPPRPLFTPIMGLIQELRPALRWGPHIGPSYLTSLLGDLYNGDRPCKDKAFNQVRRRLARLDSAHRAELVFETAIQSINRPIGTACVSYRLSLAARLAMLALGRDVGESGECTGDIDQYAECFAGLIGLEIKLGVIIAQMSNDGIDEILDGRVPFGGSRRLLAQRILYLECADLA